MANKIRYTIEVKEGREYRETYTETDPAEVYKSLASDLLRSKVLGHKSFAIRQKTNYDGTRTVIVNYGNEARRRYVVED